MTANRTPSTGVNYDALDICVKILTEAEAQWGSRAPLVYLTVAAHVRNSEGAKITYGPSKLID